MREPRALTHSHCVGMRRQNVVPGGKLDQLLADFFGSRTGGDLPDFSGGRAVVGGGRFLGHDGQGKWMAGPILHEECGDIALL
jgi:hypothetical protein